MEDTPQLTLRERIFVSEYLKDLNGTQAAIRTGHRHSGATKAGCLHLSKPAVQAEIERRMAERAKRVEISTDDVLRELKAIATADAGDLVELRRGCCRHCHGVDHKYQRTKGAQDARRREYEKRKQEIINTFDGSEAEYPAFDEEGGEGFDVRQPPHPECPECHGEGVEVVHLKDTRLFGLQARAIYAGVKATKEGVEVKMHSKEKALELLGRHLGMFKDSVDLTVKGDLAGRILKARKRVG